MVSRYKFCQNECRPNLCFAQCLRKARATQSEPESWQCRSWAAQSPNANCFCGSSLPPSLGRCCLWPLVPGSVYWGALLAVIVMDSFHELQRLVKIEVYIYIYIYIYICVCVCLVFVPGQGSPGVHKLLIFTGCEQHLVICYIHPRIAGSVLVIDIFRF